MELFDQINQHKYLYLAELGEQDTNVLRIVIEEARASDSTESLTVGAATITDLHPIISDDTCANYEITFDRYVAYSVLNESYTVGNKAEEYSGRLFRIYTKSQFADYVRVATFANDDFPGKLTHYEIVCLDHIIDIVSEVPPRIELVEPG